MSPMTAATIEPTLLPSIPIERRGQLPECPGIYFAMFQGQVLYIGLASKSLRRRWNGHHRRSDLSEIKGVHLAYIATDSSVDLRSLESELISIYCPPLNNAPIYSRGGQIPRYKDPKVIARSTAPDRPDFDSLSAEETIRLDFEELMEICDGDESMAVALEDDLWSERDVARFRYNCAMIRWCKEPVHY
jgi:hypothetical protein